MPAPQTPVLDDANRADNASAGANWGAGTYPSFGTFGIGIAGNQFAAVSNPYCESWWSAASFDANQEAYITYAASVGNGGDWGLNLRLQTPGTAGVDGYRANVFPLAGTDTIKMYRADNNVLTELTPTPAATQEWTPGTDKLRFGAVGSTLDVDRWDGANWTALASRSDSTYPNGGYLGTWMFNSGATGKLDDFGGGNMGAAGILAHDYGRFPKFKMRRVAI